MEAKKWYGVLIRSSLEPFKSGDRVYMRRAIYDRPLKVGPVVILMDPSNGRLLRVAESFGLFHIMTSKRVEFSDEKNLKIEAAYNRMREENPPAKRLPPGTVNKFRKHQVAI